MGINNNSDFYVRTDEREIYCPSGRGMTIGQILKAKVETIWFFRKKTEYSICTAALKSIIPKEGLVLCTYEDHIEGVAYDLNDIRKIRPNYLNMFFRKDALDVNMPKNFKYSPR